MKNKIIISALILATALFAGCTQTEFDAIPYNMGDSLKTTYTIVQLKSEFMKKTDAYSDADSLTNLYTSDLIMSGNEVVVDGYVTSVDTEGNVYKYFTFQENKPNGQALKVSVDASGITSLYNIGQHVWIRCNNLYIGNYGQAPQLGSRYENTEKFRVDKTTGKTFYRIEPGRMPLQLAETHVHYYGKPDPSIIKADTMTVAQINALKADTSIVRLVNKLVCIKNAYFTGFDGSNKPLTGENLIFAPSTNGVGYPQLRMINDGTGNIAIASSEYAKFATKPLPTSNYRGNITVIVGWYKNYTDAAGVWQLTIRTLSDLGKGYEGYLSQINYK
ncbi:MAG TPA: DUF5689 domain-containing protein [Paludibacteraceae bacterium]|nr:DUF5689 domain-containing protein [Paludibacteraceae bacterium]